MTKQRLLNQSPMSCKTVLSVLPVCFEVFLLKRFLLKGFLLKKYACSSMIRPRHAAALSKRITVKFQASIAPSANAILQSKELAAKAIKAIIVNRAAFKNNSYRHDRFLPKIWGYFSSFLSHLATCCTRCTLSPPMR